LIKEDAKRGAHNATTNKDDVRFRDRFYPFHKIRGCDRTAHRESQADKGNPPKSGRTEPMQRVD
jgi:hypothetical protein